MSDIYVTGHRNPDTDSIVASMAYAQLRNALGDREYKAVRIGAINDETQRLLDHFGMEPPPYIKNMRTQIRDLDFDRTPALNNSVTVHLAWQTMAQGSINVVPIVDEDGHLFGMLSAGDVASFDMQTLNENHIEDVPVFNLLSVLEGTLVNEYLTERNSVSGDLFIALRGERTDGHRFLRSACGAGAAAVYRCGARMGNEQGTGPCKGKALRSHRGDRIPGRKQAAGGAEPGLLRVQHGRVVPL